MMIYAGGAGSDQRYRREKMKQIRLLWMIIKRCNKLLCISFRGDARGAGDQQLW